MTVRRSIQIIILLILPLIGMTQGNKGYIDRSIYPLKNAKKTVLTGIWYDTSRLPDFWIYDNSKYQDAVINETVNSKVDSNGNFTLVLQLTHPIQIMPAIPGAGGLPPGSVFKNILSTRYISLGILLEPGDSITVDLRPGISIENVGSLKIEKKAFSAIPFFSEMKFSGKGVEKLWCIQAIIQNTQLYDGPGTKDTRELLLWSDSIVKMVLSTLNIYKYKLSPTAFTLIKANYLPMLAFDISEIITGENGTSGSNIKDANVKKLYKEKVKFMNTLIDPANSDLKYSFFYKNIIKRRALLEYAMDNNLEYLTISNKLKVETYNALTKYIPNNVPIKESILSSYVQGGLLRIGLRGEMNKLIDMFLSATDTSSSFHKGIRGYYLFYLDSKGGKAFSFALPDTAGKIVRMEDFKNKVVLIDFMYNECPGCRKMVPALTKVEQQFIDNRDVIFISISIDRTRDKWIGGIGKSSVANAIQLNAKENYNHPIIKFYNIAAFPQIVLIDKQGKVITTNAPDPRSDNGKALTNLIYNSLN